MNRHYPWHRRPSLATLRAAFPFLHDGEHETIRALWTGEYSAVTLRETFVAAEERHRQCYSAPTADDLALHVLDSLLGTHGVEGWTVGDSFNDGVSYCNTGDMYAATIACTPDGWFLGDLETLAARYPAGE